MTGLTFHLIPHVHWDREWYLTRSAFTARLVAAMDRLLELLESAPRLRFHLDGQMILVEDYLSIVPGARGTIEALARRGQLALGPWYVLADELIPSGVSLTRNLEIGIAMAREFGGEAPVLYSPDAFGHPAGLPDLASRFGIRWAVVWRGLGRPGGKERDLYRWRGTSGGSVLTHHLPPQGYEAGVALIEERGLRARWKALRLQLTARALTREIAIPVGADHHAPSPALPELAVRLGALEPDAEVRFSSWAEYFAAVERSAIEPGEIAGELRNSAGYVWSLQGIHSTRSRMKGRHSAAEALAVTASRLAAGPVVDRIWRDLVQSQFHDTIGGCCADAVAAEQEVRLTGVADMAAETIRQAIYRSIGHDPDRARRDPDRAEPVLAVWNPDRRARSGVVIAETTWFDRDELVGPPGDREPREGLGYRTFHLTAPDGHRVAVQVLRVAPGFERVDAPAHYPDLDRVDRVWVAAWLDLLPSQPVSVFGVGNDAGPSVEGANPVEAVGNGIGNGLIRITAESDGSFRLDDLTHGISHRHLLQIESEPDRGDLYTPDIDERTRIRARIGSARVVARGPLVGGIETTWSVAPAAGGLVRGRTVGWLEAGGAAMRVRIEFDNWADDHRLRVVLPAVLFRESVAGTPFGSARRGPGQLDRSWPEESTLPTAPAHGFVESTNPKRPFRLEWPGFFEYEHRPDGALAVTLCRSVGLLSRADGGNRRGHAGWAMSTPDAQEHGRHAMDFTIQLGAASGSAPVPLWIRSASLVDPARQAQSVGRTRNRAG